MIPAFEARELSEKAKITIRNNDLRYIQLIIDKAINNGEFEVAWCKAIDDILHKELFNLGYKVSKNECDRDIYYTISW